MMGQNETLNFELTRGWANQGTDTLASRPGGAACSVHSVPKALSLDTQACIGATLLW